MKFTSTFSFLLVAIILTTAGCSTTDDNATSGPEEGDPCESDDDCGDTMVCNSMGQCIKSGNDPLDGDYTGCQSDLDCQNGYSCINGSCQNPSTGECTSDAECGTGRRCLLPDGICIMDSTDDDDDTTDDDDDTTDDDDDNDTTDDDDDDNDTVDGDEEQEIDPYCLSDEDNDGIVDCLEDVNHDGSRSPGETDWQNPDTDGDGIEDGVEDANQDGIRQMSETDPREADSDSDGLDDGDEDTNHNGEWEPNLSETNPLSSDTDNDGLSDYTEVNSDYTGHNQTNPNSADTDGDNLPDGMEDANHNGRLELLDGETDPTMADTDGDGTPDDEESTSLVCLEDQITEVTKYVNSAGSYTIALVPEYTYTEINSTGATGGAFDHATLNLAGFIVTVAPAGGVQDIMDQVNADAIKIQAIDSDGIINQRSRAFTTYDEFEAVITHVAVEIAGSSVGALRKKMISSLTGVGEGSLGAVPAGSSESGAEYEIILEHLWRDASHIVTMGTIITRTRYDDVNDRAGRNLAIDTTDGSAISGAISGTLNNCDYNQALGVTPVDFLWVVDESGSMSNNQQAVADAASIFTTVLGNAGIDYRLGVTGEGCYRDATCPFPWPLLCDGYPVIAGELASGGFVSDVQTFQNNVQNAPCPEDEYGLAAGIAAINRASNPALPANERLRPDAALIVVWLTDEEDQEYEDCSNSSCETSAINNYDTLYNNAGAIGFGIVAGEQDNCPGGEEEWGSSYQEIAQRTGGAWGSICAPDLTPFMEQIVRAAAGEASIFELRKHPISQTIQVMVEGSFVPRSPDNGFEYDAISKTVVFYGDARPDEGADVAISYRYWDDDPK